MPYWEELKWNDVDDVGGPGDVRIPETAHHMQARAEIDLLVESGALEAGEAGEAMRIWKAESEIDDSDKALGAIGILRESGVIGEDEAEDLRGRLEAPA